MAVQTYRLPDIRNEIENLLKDDAGFLTSDQRNVAINRAIKQVSHDRPFGLVVDITGDGTKTYDIEGVGFKRGWSDIKTVEHPAAEDPPVFRDRDDDWIVYEDPSKTEGARMRLLFLSVTPTSAETIRVTFTQPHTVTEGESTLTETEFLAVVYLCMVILYRALAAKFAQSMDPTIDADAVDYGGRSQNYLFLSERYMTDYKNILGFGEEGVTAAQALAEVDIIFSHGEQFLFHHSRTR